MRKINKLLVLTVVGWSLMGEVFAQQGRFETRLRSRRVDCQTRSLQVDVEIRASDAASTFRMGNGNFRIAYDPAFVRNPILARQHHFSPASETPDANYASQSLNGSTERPGGGIVSLNVIYAGAERGAALVGTDWTPIATLQFEIVNLQASEGTTLRLNDDKSFPVSGLDEVILKNENGAFDYTSRVVTPAGVFESLTLPSFASICSGSGAESTGEVQIPDGFSPNGDGTNDRFVIGNLGSLKAEVQIFDRLGTMIYDSKDYKNDWDGQTSRGLINPGTYFYTVKLSDGRRFSSSLTVIR